MGGLCLYYDLLSQPCRALYTFLKVNDIHFEPGIISLAAGEHKTPEFAEINPRKKLPAISDGDFNLSESIAILRYIVDKYGNQIPDHWYPRDPKARAKVDEYLEYQHLGTRLHYAMLFLDELTSSRTGRETDPKQKEKLVKNMQKITHIVEKTFLGDQLFMCGDEISVADIFAAHEMLQIVGVGRDPVAGHPKLAAWLDRVSQRLNPHFADSLKDIYALSGQEVARRYQSKY